MQIHTYAGQGNIEGVARELANSVAVDTTDERNPRTPLMCAVTSAEAGLDMVRFLVEKGADVNAIAGDFDDTVLGLAVRSGDIDKITFLLDAGANINYQRPSGYDVLIDAMFCESMGSNPNLIPVVELLIERGARADGRSDYSESALSVASNYGRFDVVGVLLSAGGDPQYLEWTELMFAVALGSLQDVEQHIAGGADLSARDFWSRTPWLLSLQTGDTEKTRLLLAAGSHRDDRGRCGKTPIMYAIENEHVHVLKWLLEEGFDIDATDDFKTTPLMAAAEQGATECVKLLLAAGASVEAEDHIKQKAIEKASTIEIVRLLLSVGQDLNDIDDSVRALLTGVEAEGELQVTRKEYLAGKHPRFGKKNPQIMDIAFWKAMIRSGATAWAAQVMFRETDKLRSKPIWCFHRFGKSITELPDGRFIEIGGEHEDYYDLNFCIYNDVVVHHGGGNFVILGYPEKVFPPTDFHSATLIGNFIYIIGCLGYPEQRKYEHTPVYRLNCQTFAIEKVATTGEHPGWISGHKAVYTGNSELLVKGGKLCALVNGAEDYFDNPHRHVLNLDSMTWRRLDRSSDRKRQAQA